MVRDLPPDAGKIVALVNHRDRIIMATEYRLYEIVTDEVTKTQRMVPLDFEMREIKG